MRVVLAFTLVALSACASRIETVKIDPGTLQPTGPGVQGVVYYEPRLVKVRYEFTQLVDKEKGLVGSSEKGGCTPVVQKEEIVTLPDYQRPRAILHKPSWLASHEFGVTLNNGMLVSVTSKSTPQAPQLLEQIVKAAEVGFVREPGPPACNAGPVITRVEAVTF